MKITVVCFFLWKKLTKLLNLTDIEEEQYARTEAEKYYIEAKKSIRDYKEHAEEMEKELEAARKGTFHVTEKL